MNRFSRLFPRLFALSLLLLPKAAEACSVCYGNSDAPMSKALGWGVLVLLAVVLAVLGGIAAFFVFIAKRSATMSQAGLSTTLSDPIKKVS